MFAKYEIRELLMQDYLKIIKKRWKLIAASVLVFLTITAINDFTKKPIYRATTSLLIEKTPPRVTQFEEIFPTTPYYFANVEYYQTQYKLLGSRIIAARAFDDLRLGKDPDFKDLKDPVSGLRSMIRVEPLRNSQMVLVHVEDTNPMRASLVANAVAKQYIQLDIETRNRTAKEAGAWLEVQLSGIKEKLQKAEEALNDYVQKNKIVTVPDAEKKTQTLLESLKQERAKLDDEYAEAQKRYKEKHPKIIALTAQLEDINKKIEEETNSLLTLNERLVQYNVLKKDADSTQQLYTAMLTRAKEADVSEKITASGIRIIDFASPPKYPVGPRKMRDMLIAILFGTFAGIVASIFLEHLDLTVRTAEDVSHYLELPFLGYIPPADKEAVTEYDKNTIVAGRPRSVVAESYRNVRTSLLFAMPEDKPLKTILITSSLPQEGKTFVSSNLSLIFGHVNEKIVLVDTDMRRPKVHIGFNVEQKGGLSDYLAGNLKIEDILKNTPMHNVSIITAGTTPPNPSELLSSGKVQSFFQDLRSKFDRVIIDSPPILSVSDTALLIKAVDGVIIVVKGGSTHTDAALQTKDKILEAKGKIVGIVINNIEPEKADKYYYYHYYYNESSKTKSK